MKMREEYYKTICRVCLSKENSGNMVPLYNISTEYGQSLTCFGKAVLCFTNISFGNRLLPNYMCRKCLSLLKQAIIFKKTCEKSHETLTKLIEKCDGSESTIKELVTDYMIYKTYFPDKAYRGSSLVDNEGTSANHPPAESHNNLKIGDQNVQQKEVKLESLTIEIQADDSEDVLQNEQNLDQDDTNNSEVIIDDNEKDLDDIDIVSDIEIDSKELIHHQKINIKPKNIQNHTKRSILKKELNKKRNIKCKVCKKILANIYTYRNHMQRHSGRYRFVCDLCAKGFSMRALLESHQASIHGIGDFINCQKCDYKTIKPFEMMEHERTHTGERPFTCDKCGKTFRRQFIWRKHLLYHEEKTVQCTECPRKFYQVGEMRSHYNNVHERVRVYQCSECEVTFAKPATVRKHLALKHGITREKQGKITKIRLGKLN